MKENKAITLVALVVTIIVLILLAGISINLLLGENGIITKAKEAKKAQEIVEIKEKLSLEIAAAETDAILRNENLEKTQLEDIINKYGTLQEDEDTIITKKNNYEISLKEIWYGVLSQSGSYSDKVEQIEILEKELTELQEKYKELEEINSGNSEILEGLRNQIIELENEKSALEESLNNVQERLAEAENKLIEFKTAIATAITNQGVKTSADGTADIMAENIGKILTSNTAGTAIAGNILSGKTAWVNGSKVIGTMENKGALNWNPTTSTTYTVPAGYYSGGTLNSSGAYNTGYNKGVKAADNRANSNSVNYQTGYNAGYNAGTQNPGYYIEEVNMGSGGATICHIIYNISNANVTSISFQIRRGGSQANSPSIYFSEDGTTYTKIATMATGSAYAYVDEIFDIPEGYKYVKLEWEIGSDRAWFNNIKFN